MMKQYAPALKHIADIIEKGIREHPGIDQLSALSMFTLFGLHALLPAPMTAL